MSRPVALLLVTYVPVCYMLSLPGAGQVASGADEAIQAAAQGTAALSEAAKVALQGAQLNMAASFIPARSSVMQQVADANYVNDGAVHVDTIPITDNFLLFDGTPFINPYSDADRVRFKEATVDAANKDDFVKQRSWTSDNNFLCVTKAEFRRRGGTELTGFDQWKAMDTASLHEWKLKWHGLSLKCDGKETKLGYGAQAAAKGRPNDLSAQYGNSRSDNPGASGEATSSDWKYSGLPTFYDLSGPALKYLATEATPRLKFSIRLTRAKGQTRTSDGTSIVKPSGRLANFDDKPASGVLAAVSTSEVFFERPVARSDGKTELASLFNPYWQVHLIPTSAVDMAHALAKGGPQ